MHHGICVGNLAGMQVYRRSACSIILQKLRRCSWLASICQHKVPDLWDSNAAIAKLQFGKHVAYDIVLLDAHDGLAPRLAGL